MKTLQVLSLQVRLNLGIIAMKEYCALTRVPELEPHHQMQFSVISRLAITPQQGKQSAYFKPCHLGNSIVMVIMEKIGKSLYQAVDEKMMIHTLIVTFIWVDIYIYIYIYIYYNKFKTSNLVIRNNSSPSIGVLQKTNVIYNLNVL